LLLFFFQLVYFFFNLILRILKILYQTFNLFILFSSFDTSTSPDSSSSASFFFSSICFLRSLIHSCIHLFFFYSSYLYLFLHVLYRFFQLNFAIYIAQPNPMIWYICICGNLLTVTILSEALTSFSLISVNSCQHQASPLNISLLLKILQSKKFIHKSFRQFLRTSVFHIFQYLRS